MMNWSNSKARLRSIELLNKLGHPVNDNLPLLGSIEIKKSLEEVLNRANALHILCTIGTENDPKCTAIFKKVIKDKHWAQFFTKNELSIINDGQLTAQNLLDFSWAKEALFALIWAVNITNDDIYYLGEIFVSNYTSKLPPERSWEDFFKSASKRPSDQIAQALDFYYNLHWSLKRRDRGLVSMEHSITIERRRALEWLAINMRWDEISLDT